MSLSLTYATLTQLLQDWLEDDDAEFVGSIPEVIGLGETRLLRDLDLAIFDDEDASTTTVIGVSLITKPAIEAVSIRSIGYQDDTRFRFLELRGPDFLADFAGAANGPPKYYAEESETEWIIAPPPDAIYTLRVRYVARPAGLSGAVTETWLSKHAADGLFKACLAEAEGFLKSDDRKPIWEADYVRDLPNIRREVRALAGTSYGGLGMTPMPGGGQ